VPLIASIPNCHLLSYDDGTMQSRPIVMSYEIAAIKISTGSDMTSKQTLIAQMTKVSELHQRRLKSRPFVEMSIQRRRTHSRHYGAIIFTNRHVLSLEEIGAAIFRSE
jgi:hypothetical protein